MAKAETQGERIKIVTTEGQLEKVIQPAAAAVNGSGEHVVLQPEKIKGLEKSGKLLTTQQVGIRAADGASMARFDREVMARQPDYFRSIGHRGFRVGLYTQEKRAPEPEASRNRVVRPRPQEGSTGRARRAK